jgi:hypothetical protein
VLLPGIASGIGIDPTLRRDGTDFITLEVVMRFVFGCGLAVSSEHGSTESSALPPDVRWWLHPADQLQLILGPLVRALSPGVKVQLDYSLQ